MELRIIRLAMRRMIATAKKKKPLVPAVRKPKMKLGSSHRNKK